MYKYFISLVLAMFLVISNVVANEFKVTKPFVQLGHSFYITCLDISPNGKYAISGGFMGALKLWDIKTNKEIRTFRGHKDAIISVAISPDGKYVISNSSDKTLRIWDIKTGKKIKAVWWRKGSSSISITPDGKYILSGNRDGTLSLWNIKTNKYTKTFKGSSSAVYSTVMTPDEKYIISGSEDGKLKLWDIKTAKVLKTFAGHTNSVSSIIITSDGKYAISLCFDGVLKLWDIKTSKLLKNFKGHSGGIYSSEKINTIAITPDGKYIVLGSEEGKLKLWDIRTGKVLKDFKGQADFIQSLAITPDGKYVLTGNHDGVIKLWNLKMAKEIKTSKGRIDIIQSIAITPDEKYVFSKAKRGNNWSNVLKKWNLKLAKEVKNFPKGHNTKATISLDGNYVLFRDSYSVLELWDLRKSKKIQMFKDKGHMSDITSLSVSLDGKYAISGSYDKTLKLWNIKTGKNIRTLKGHAQEVNCVAITPDSKYVVSGSKKLIGGSGSWGDKDNKYIGEIKLWDIKTGKNIRDFKGHTDKISSLAITSNGKYAFSASWDGTLIQWDIKTGKNIKTFKGHRGYVLSVAIAPNGKYILSGGYDRTLRLWDIKTAKNIRIFKGHVDFVESVSITKDSKYALSGSWDGTLKLWNIKTGKELLTMVSFSNGEWVSITPEGYFTASKNGAKHINILTGPIQVSSIDQYYETFYRPDIVASVMSDSKDKYASQTLKLSDIKPAPQVAIIDTKESIDKEELKVTLKITPSSGGIGQIRLYLDGVLIKTDGDRGLQKKQNKNIVLKTYTIKLPKGKHTIKAIVYNEANTMASHEDILVVVSTYSQVTKPNIYAVVVGINEYKNPAIGLKYAVSDAELFAKTIKKRTKGLYGDVKVQLLITKEQTSKKYITKVLKDLKNISPNDLFIFFVASHGMIEDAKYHMITSNVGALSSRAIKREAISQDSLRDMLANVPTTKKFIILDTCNSGALGKSIEVELLTRGLTETTAMKVLSRAVGSTIISASSSSQEH